MIQVNCEANNISQTFRLVGLYRYRMQKNRSLNRIRFQLRIAIPSVAHGVVLSSPTVMSPSTDLPN